MSPEQAIEHQRTLNELLSQGKSEVIYQLANWLNVLGLNLTVTAHKVDKNNANIS